MISLLLIGSQTVFYSACASVLLVLRYPKELLVSFGVIYGLNCGIALLHRQVPSHYRYFLVAVGLPLLLLCVYKP